MPFVSGETLTTLHEQNEVLTQELRQYEELGPLLDLAIRLRDEMVERMEESGDFKYATAQEIGDIAYRNVLKEEMSNARDDVVADFQQIYRTQLYERVIAEVKATEGDDIRARVQQRLDTDPELAIELRESARKELGARALHDVRISVTEKQQEVIDREAERQMALDGLDVDLALNGRLDLLSGEVEALLAPGDRVDLHFENQNKKNRLTIEWAKDARNNTGWVYVDSERLFYYQGGRLRADSTFFTRPATVNVDRTTGDDVIQADILTTGLPLALISQKRGSRNQILRYLQLGHTSYGSSNIPAILRGSDFHTKNIEFFSQIASGEK